MPYVSLSIFEQRYSPAFTIQDIFRTIKSYEPSAWKMSEEEDPFNIMLKMVALYIHTHFIDNIINHTV